MFRHCAMVLCVSGLMFSGATIARAAAYAFFDLGAVGDSSSYAWGINNGNTLVGRAFSDGFAGGGSRATTWSGTTRTVFPTLNGTGNVGNGFAINDSGVVAGMSSSTTPGGNQAFTVNGDGANLINLGAKIPGSPGTSKAMAINSSGEVAGYAHYSSDQGFYWDGVSASAERVYGPGGSILGELLGINSAGVAVGHYVASDGSGAYDRTVRWQHGDAEATDLNGSIKAALAPTDSCSSQGFAINDSGELVGYYEAGMDVNYRAYLYKDASHIVALGNLGGDGGGSLMGANALAINNNGYVVGYSATAGNAAQHAFLWSPNTDNGTTGSMADLNGLLNNALAIPAGYYLYSATGINNAGNISGYMYNGAAYRAFVLRVALPGDANLDGAVDVTDLSKVLTNYNKGGVAWADGDFDGNGSVDVTDLSKVLTNYNNASGAAGGGIGAVPEPSSIVLGALGLLGLAMGRRHKRN